MTEDPAARRLSAPDWHPRTAVDLDTVIELGQADRRRRRARRRAAGALVATVVIAGGVAARPLLSADRSRPATIGPAASGGLPTYIASTQPPATGPAAAASAPPSDADDCAGADTTAAAAVSRDIKIVSSSDYRTSDSDNRLDVTAGAVRAKLAATLPTLRQTLAQERVVSVATVRQIGYIGGGCQHPRYLVAFSLRTSRAAQKASEIGSDVYVVSALPVDGTYKLDRIEPVDFANG